MNNDYSTPPSVAMFFQTFVDVGEYLEFVASKLIELQNSNKNDKEWISPVVYSRQGKVFNVDYNFLIMCLSEWTGKDAIEGDFLMTNTSNSDVVKNGLFLVVSLLEDYFDVVRVRQKKIDLSKFKTAQIFNIVDKFYNMIVIQNGDNFKRFSAVPFSGSRVKSLISLESYNDLVEVSDKDEYVQAAFGTNQFGSFVKKIGSSPEFVSV